MVQKPIDKEITEYTKRDADFIYKQLCLYKPDIIICCGRGDGKNADLLHEYVLPNKTMWQLPIEKYNYFYTHFEGKDRQTPVISFNHPQLAQPW
ncbi:hypothetical protein [Brevibacillus reuszeri]|uniref:hypothetical protein n=1 Tax=Brevibacillus reuszeri TaxID=54915 RepID=UPI003D208FE0